MPKEAIIEGHLNREKIVKDTIVKHTEIPQAKLKKIIVPEHMAKTTFEKTLKNIQLKGLADFRYEGIKKIWYVEGATVSKFKDLEKWIKDLEKKLPKISKEFHNKTLTEKAQEVKWLFSLYEANMSFLNLMYLLENTPKKEYEKSLELMHRFLKINVSIWKKDKDSEQLIAELMMSIIKTSPFFSGILQVLDESRKINWLGDRLPDRLPDRL
jgi:hypothetical protein